MEDKLKTTGRRLLIIWVAASGLFAALLGILVLREGTSFIHTIMGTGDGTPHLYRFIIYWIGWFWIGVILFLSQFTAFSGRNLAFLIVLVFLGYLYLNQIREPHTAGVGDFPVYFEAAVTMNKGEKIRGRELAQQAPGTELKPGELYIYPPLLASVMSPFVYLGLTELVGFFHIANYLAVVLLAILLYLILPRYNLSREMAAIGIFLVMVVNVPIMRTLTYHQINVFVLDFILLSLLFYPRSSFLSALSLSLAIHLKVYPVLLVIPFVLLKDWRWLSWFAVSHILIVVATSLITSPIYYLDFLLQLNSLAETGLRNTSVNTFLYNTFRVFGFENPALHQVLSYLIRFALLLLFALPAVRIIRKQESCGDAWVQKRVLISFALLPIAMLLISPSIWEHHYVLLILSPLVILSWLRSATELWLFALAYSFIFILPVVELYPISYLPLLALIIFVALIWMIAEHSPESEHGWISGLRFDLSVMSADHD